LKRKALFIINPISGGKKKDGVPDLIKKNLNAETFETIIVFSDSVAHARQIAAEAANKFNVIVAVGGDGTVNEVASAITGSNSALGIVPYGSGNGLSRFLGISMNAEDAIRTLASGPTVTIDSGKLNGHPFFNMAGMGFDAHIAEVFSHGKKRGLVTYVESSMSEFAKYKPETYHIEIDGKLYELELFMLSLANSSQYGNNAHISPHASVQDGLLDVCMIKKFPLWRLPEMAVRMITKTSDKTKYVEIVRGKKIHIKRSQPGPIHLDGEPHMAGTDIHIEVIPGSLQVIVGSSYKNK
jgi:diacylglycerol kinase (ATP)